ncbi:hypothetical protein KW868_05215 [Acinetobacter guillouiae]|uniref:Uncharacterized protein n=1 Tax=Acinetobacter guillouiae TaxID=106649 RepID=A0A8X8GID4_ACIGI|nr:hypothetical protein [Acinetobacter guillouiae]MCF0263869.1 hypothetical protein [Acinetobacter guillouiae]
MFYFEFGVYIFILLIISWFLAKKNLKIINIACFVFLLVFFIIWLILHITPDLYGGHAQYFFNGKFMLNNTAKDFLIISFTIASTTTAILSGFVWACRFS